MAGISTEDKRRRLIKLASGTPQYYTIEYCVDVKGNITIFAGAALGDSADSDLFLVSSTEEYIWLYDNRRNGADFMQREREAAENTPREAIVNAYLEFRAKHPHDGYGISGLFMNDDRRPNEQRRDERDDIADVKLELKRRNRQYIAELYGDVIPLDYDFLAAYNAAEANKIYG